MRGPVAPSGLERQQHATVPGESQPLLREHLPEHHAGREHIGRGEHGHSDASPEGLVGIDGAPAAGLQHLRQPAAYQRAGGCGK